MLKLFVLLNKNPTFVWLAKVGFWMKSLLFIRRSAPSSFCFIKERSQWLHWHWPFDKLSKTFGNISADISEWVLFQISFRWKQSLWGCFEQKTSRFILNFFDIITIMARKKERDRATVPDTLQEVHNMKLKTVLPVWGIILAVLFSGCGSSASNENISGTADQPVLCNNGKAAALSAYREILVSAPALEGEHEELSDASFNYEQNAAVIMICFRCTISIRTEFRSWLPVRR